MNDYINLETPCGICKMPIGNEYKDKTDIELLELLLKQNKRFIDPVLIQILVNKKLLNAGDHITQIKANIKELQGEVDL